MFHFILIYLYFYIYPRKIQLWRNVFKKYKYTISFIIGLKFGRKKSTYYPPDIKLIQLCQPLYWSFRGYGYSILSKHVSADRAGTNPICSWNLITTTSLNRSLVGYWRLCFITTHFVISIRYSFWGISFVSWTK